MSVVAGAAWGILAATAAVLAWEDWRTREVSWMGIGVLAAAGAVAAAATAPWRWPDHLVGCVLTGVPFAGLHRWRGVGLGDVAIAAAAGFALGSAGLFVWLAVSGATSVVATVILLARGRRGTDEIAFAPYLLAGWVVAAWPWVGWLR